MHCTAHALDLAIEKIGKIKVFAQAIKAHKQLIKEITNHEKTSSAFRELSNLKLLKPGLSPNVPPCSFSALRCRA